MKRAALFLMAIILSVATAQATPDYILIRQRFWGGMKLTHVSKPQKKLHKWYHDTKTDTYYRMKDFWGFGIRIK